VRVLQFGRFWNDQHGGVERQAHLLSKGLAAEGIDVVNLVAAHDLTARDEQVDGFRLVQTPSYGMAFRTAMSPALIFKALQLHREQPFDVFHFHLQDPLSHLVSMLLPNSVKRVITWHHDIVRQRILLLAYSPFLRRLLRQADAIVAATAAHFDTAQIPATISKERLHVIPYGIDFAPLSLNERTTALRDQLREKAGDLGLIFALGRHVSYKGFNVLIDALQETKAMLMLGGQGPLTDSLREQAQALGVADRVIFSGRIPEDDLAAYFHACDVFCLPSVSQMEAFGLVQLEAMICGKPVVCTQLGNGVNVVNVEGKTGLSVPVEDAHALAQAINRLLADEGLRVEMGRFGRERALQVYSLEAMTQSHVSLYQALLNTRR
jgi:glycosyltransferase involved in cell wall biosynthesis